MPEFIEVCQQAALAGGAALRHWQGKFKVREKGPADLVTEADLASQEAVRQTILAAFPDHGILAEEGEEHIGKSSDQYRWIVDPLDGTTNYVHGFPQFAVSVALERKGALLAGCIYDPTADECFLAGAGQGAYLNGVRMKVSGVENLGEALVAASFPPLPNQKSDDVKQFGAVLAKAQSVRRTGSAALNLTYVAAGRLDAYWALDNKAWDVAAGILLVTEAGGVATALDGGPIDLQAPRLVVAATASLHSQLRQVVNGR